MATRSEIRERLGSESSDRLWWTWRFLELVLRDFGTDKDVSNEDASLAVGCFTRLSTADADWAMAKLMEEGPEGHAFSKLLEGGRMETALAGVEASGSATDARLRARMLIASARWTHAAEHADPLWRRAWSELERVSPDRRDQAWKESALLAAARAAYPVYRPLVDEKLGNTQEAFWRAALLASALPVAARNRDWESFDRWLTDYRALPESFRSDHAACAIMNLEGLTPSAR
jgi:hypothetical protein